MSILLIKKNQPVIAQRTKLFQGDEATVSLISEGSHNGLVERLQKLAPIYDRQSEREFKIIGYGADDLYCPRAEEIEYHIAKFLALRVANALFPENFIQPSELRFFADSESLFSVMYSPFVPGETAILERKKIYTQAHRNALNYEEANAIRKNFDDNEYLINPQLKLLVDKMWDCGLWIPHAQVNYTMVSNKPVFFEIYGLDIEKTIKTISESNNDEAQKYLAAMTSVLLCCYVRREFGNSNNRFRKSVVEAFKDDIETINKLYGIILDLLPQIPKKFNELKRFEESISSNLNFPTLLPTNYSNGSIFQNLFFTLLADVKDKLSFYPSLKEIPIDLELDVLRLIPPADWTNQ